MNCDRSLKKTPIKLLVSDCNFTKKQPKNQLFAAFYLFSPLNITKKLTTVTRIALSANKN